MQLQDANMQNGMYMYKYIAWFGTDFRKPGENNFPCTLIQRGAN